MSGLAGGRPPRPYEFGLYDYVFKEINSNKFLLTSGGGKQGVDDLDPIHDLLTDNNSDIKTFVGGGDWETSQAINLAGISGESHTVFPILRGAGQGITKIQPKGASIHGIHLTNAVTPTIEDFTVELDTATVQFHGIYAQDDPSEVGYPELGMYKGVIDNVGVTGGKNHTGLNDYYGMCIETSEFYKIGNLNITGQGYRRNGLSLRQVDGTISYSYHDSVIFGKNMINVDGESVIGLDIQNINSNKPINLIKNTGAMWIRNASGATSTGIHIKDAQRIVVPMIHTEDFNTAFHVEGGDTHNLELGGGLGYSYVDSGGIFFDIDAGQDIRLPNWFIAANNAFTLIDCESGTKDAPIELDFTIQGAGAVTYGLNQYVRFKRHRGHGGHNVWGVRQ